MVPPYFYRKYLFKSGPAMGFAIVGGRVSPILKTVSPVIILHYIYTGTLRDCDGDRYSPVAGRDRPLLEVYRQNTPQPGEIPRSENCLSNNLPPPAGSTALLLPNHGSLFVADGRRR